MHLYMRTSDVRKRCMRACTCVCVRARTMERVSASRNRYRPAECLGEDWTRKQRLGGRIHGENDECGCVNRSHSRAGIPTPNPPVTLSLPLARFVYVNERTAAGHRRAAASPPTENQYIGSPVLSPAKSQFLRSTSSRAVLFFDLSRPRIGATRSSDLARKRQPGMTRRSFFALRQTAFFHAP